MELAVVRSNHKISPATYTPEMDPKIWRKLPIELLERILSFLPLRTFLYLRSTCKYFRSLIFSPVFLSRHTNSLSSSPLSSFLLLSHPQSTHYLMYDTDLNTWRNLKLPLSRSLSCTPLLSTASCLLCFSAVPDSSNSAFLIYNLLARSSRIVKFPEFPFAFELPTLITNSSGYKLFCLSSRSSSHVYAYVYDSRVRQWIRYDGFHRSLGDSYHQQGVFCNGSLYFGTREPFSVVGFDLNTGKWERLEVSLPEDLTFARLAAGENRLFMFGGIGRNGISKTMKVWELDEQERIWMEVESVPDMMCRKFGSVCYHNYEHIYCFWHQGMICVCCYTWPEVLYYMVSRRTWHWLPKCPSLPHKSSCGFKWFSFAPQLYAAV
ncbi:F-box/kelch-repeat protein At5g43190 [Cynara cardunculus var. scolymus]|uniref:F-box domain, cyclin-like protein n=1 Tax=Cynara cardunculus var. scolymus TaxID=59895 RepID=A0A103XZ09_CYNCS|nr:F-box/kelch-repeat protein At5g43190 [Cynara cardunculus var. scolymus]KVH99420.1 F-box domain, cyclin-like protein [Cynara cardunculus var. scolymus]